MNSNQVSHLEKIVACYHDLLRREYKKFKKNRGDIRNSRLEIKEIEEICKRYSISYEDLVRRGLIIPLTKDCRLFHTQHMTLIEKLVKVQPWPNLPPVPLEHDLVMSEDVKIPELEVDLDEFIELLQVKISKPGLPPVVDAGALRKIVEIVWWALGIEKLYRFQADYSAEILASLLGRSSKEVFLLAAPTGMGKTETFVMPSLVYSLLVNERGVKVLLIYPRKSLERDQLQKLVRAITRINMRLDEVGRYNEVRLGIDDGDSYRSEIAIREELKKTQNSGGRRLITFRGIMCPLCESSKKSDVGRISWQYVDGKNLSLKCSIDPSHEFGYITDIKEEIWKDPPDILITNIYTLNRRLMYRESKKIFG